jgi:glycosyltransferase involved in cell wall biosynthesis
MSNYFKFQLALRRRLPGLLREYHPELFIAHHAQMPDLFTSSSYCPIVVTTHTTILGQARGTRAAMRHGGPLDESEKTTMATLPALIPAELYYWQRVRHALFVSNAVRQEVEGTYAPRLRTSTVILNGLDPSEVLTPAKEPTDSDLGGNHIFLGGRLLSWKGIAVLLKALARIRIPERLIVTGSGRVAAWQSYARSLGLGEDRVQFLGVIPRADMLARLHHAKLVVVPSFTESCPYSLIEAMAMGKAVVASSLPGTRDMIEDGISGVLVPPGDPPALGAAIVRLLEDESLRRRLGDEAAAVAKSKFALNRMCDDTMRYFERVLAAS